MSQAETPLAPRDPYASLGRGVVEFKKGVHGVDDESEKVDEKGKSDV